MSWYYLFLVALIEFHLTVCLAKKDGICSAEDIADADIEDQTYANSEPFGSKTEVTILKRYYVKSNSECLKNCCYTTKCDSVTVVRNTCILYECNPREACKPKRMSGFGVKLIYIFLRSSNSSTSIVEHQLKKMDDLDENTQPCELGVPENCPANAICKRTIDEKRSGVCVCMSGFARKASGCIEVMEDNQKKQPINSVTETPLVTDVITMADAPSSKTTTTTTSSKRQSTSPGHSSSSTKSPSKPHSKNIFAHAGPEKHVHVQNPHLSTYPDLVSVNGSATNKHGIILTNGVSYQWKRDIKSLSVGRIVNNSDQMPTLMLMNLIQGKYIFVLTVTDISGEQSSDSVNIFVVEKSDDRFGNLVDVLFETNVYTFTEQDTINFSRRMGHVIEKNLGSTNCRVHVISVTGDRKNRTLISFYADIVDPSTKETQALSAGVIEEKLKVKLTQNKFIFDYAIKKLQSRVCYNSCGSHGTCCPYSHRCVCSLPWMNNPWHERSTGFSNCDMHVMIIVVICVAVLFVSVLVFLVLRTMYRICKRKRRYGKDVLRYKLLDNADS